MKKKTILLIVLAIVVCACVGVLAVRYAVQDGNKIQGYTVKFDSDGGTAIDDIVVEKGATISAPTEPQKEGHIFTGWYTSKDYNEKFLFDSTPITEDLVLYADWVSGDTDTMLCRYVAYQLDIQFQNGDNINHVTKDVVLPTQVEGVDGIEATWESSSNFISTTGKVTRPAENDETITLSVTVKKNDASYKLDYSLTVIHANDRDKATIPNNSVVDVENMNEGKEFDISYNEDKTQVVSIEGKYSEITVDNTDDALDVVQSIHTIVGIKNPYDELKILTNNSDEYGAEYTFVQMYNGYEVYSRRITISVDADGVTDFLGSGVYATSKLESVNTNKGVSQDAAEQTAQAHFGGECTVAEGNTTFMYYTINEYEESPKFVYAVYVSGKDDSGKYIDGIVFIDANAGDIVGVNSETTGASADTGSGKTEQGNKVTFPIAFTWTDWYFYYMQDLERDIQMYDQKMFVDFRIGSEFNWWTDKTAISAYTNMIKTYDWYKNVLNRDSLDGNGFDLKVVVHNDHYSDNAYWSGSEKTLNFCDNGFGSSLKATTAGALDVVAHEYTHGIVQFVTGGLPYQNAPGAINEGYADIFGCLVDGDWQIGEDWQTIRDASNPTKYQAPDKISSEFYVDYTVDSSDNGGVHTNSSLLYHAAYLMSEAGVPNNTLAKLWYKSLSMGYDGTSDFQTVRKNVLKAAKKIKLSEEQIVIIKNAFDAVEIFGDRGTLEGTVSELAGNKKANTEIKILHNGAVVKTISTDANGCFDLLLDEGEYIVEVSCDGYVKYTSSIEITEDETTTVEIILVKEGVGNVNGVVVSATSALSIDGVELNVRKGMNVKAGDIVKTARTNNSGEYAFELEAGYYTIEMIRDGYTTGYINVLVSAGANVVANGSLSPIMTSDTYRVVLTWGRNPSDLDSHLVGQAEDGSSYHVYYSSKNGYDNSRNLIANLDVDDTTSYGPETTTFSVDTAGTYKFYVHRYSSGSLPDSGATVEVYNGYNLIAKYIINSDASDGCRYWDVFTIENGIFKTVNTMR